MANLLFDVDVEKISELFGDLKEQVAKDVQKGTEDLATMTHAKTMELAKDELGSLSQKYMENVQFTNPDDNIWIVTLKEPAMWIEEGRKSGFMDELLEGKSAKTSKDGEKYAVIPFEHNVNPSQQSAKAQELANEIKEGLRKKGINWQKIERDSSGSPRLGRLHNVNVGGEKKQPQHKTPATHGVSVYQHKDRGGNVRRSVVTFRVIHEKHRQEGLWFHPGREGDQLLDKALEWAEKEWENVILPTILEKYEDR